MIKYSETGRCFAQLYIQNYIPNDNFINSFFKCDTNTKKKYKEKIKNKKNPL